MPINITMPALSPTMEEGNLAKWLIKEGDSVSPGDAIAEIETDKATMEVEAVDEGTLAKIVVPDGTEGVKVNALIGVLAEEGEDPADAAKAAEDGGGGSSDRSGKAEQAKAEETAGGAADEAQAKSSETPKEGDTPQADKAPATTGTPAPKSEKGERIFASPLARRLAREAGLDLSAVKGSGPHGRIVQRDIEEAKEKGTATQAEASQAGKAAQAAPDAPKPMADEQVLKLFEEGSYELKPHDGMRKTIARRLVQAKTTIPHFYLTVDCELDALLDLRRQINASAPMRKNEHGEKPAFKLSVNDMVIKAMALALRDIPEANVSWTEQAMVQHKSVNVGVAVSIEGGLITPIVKRAEEKSLSAISNEMKDLARRARDRKLQPQEYQGGATAVSNLGMFGIKDFAAVINPPHATILAVGAGEKRAVVKDDAVGVATIMSVTLSTDHRAVDGALGAEVLAAFKNYIENPMGMLV
ncbi:pyruvate dehydrogenase complex dihydrolipoamide acetyltransferase [Pararhizobium mangrovi]|uniref:Acetyltransferase component of pyruvate dehydrogenase complex n=1 Tax=Pararhizobium mangrovi TaxID=2590452 RepID=A0A506UEZ1_9HYPH|nr:pyruvate dehydrogenase complex dihydrolipoamide acetyltransferase [Pararhizobium mangrovi]TPW31359.1 pyruvate dehydrogenase complex dihydrolipoamide acetyltransferase [Pararhizobium mangrovi]